MIRLNNAGETIIEVLVSVAMLALAITGTMVVARDSLGLGQTASERTQALKIAETQIERIKQLVTSTPGGGGAFSTSDFCVRGDLSIVTSLPPSPVSDCSNSYFPSSNLSVVVSYSASGPDGNLGNVADNDLFTISVEWDNVRGSGRNSVVIDYRLHPVV